MNLATMEYHCRTKGMQRLVSPDGGELDDLLAKLGRARALQATRMAGPREALCDAISQRRTKGHASGALVLTSPEPRIR
jgi:Arc/MetJ family transcription regulator